MGKLTKYGLLGPYFQGKTCKIWAFRAIFRSLKFAKIISITVPLSKKRKIRKNTSSIHSKSYEFIPYCYHTSAYNHHTANGSLNI
jgi:hypothetical protein